MVDDLTTRTFRFFVVLMCVGISFFLTYNLHEIQKNRDIAYNVTALNCATLKGAIEGLATQHKDDPFVTKAFQDHCLTGKVIQRYPDAGK